MAIRRVICDYAGNDLHVGDLVNYSSRTGNRVRAADAVIRKVTTKRGPLGQRIPVLRVEPTGVESGFVKRQSFREEWIGAEHVRLIATAAEMQRA